MHNVWDILSKKRMCLFIIITATLYLSLILTACSPSYPQIKKRFKPGMTYKDVVALFGKEGQPVTDNEAFQYQWYVDDYVRVLVKFIEPDEVSTFNDYVMHSYRFEVGYAHIRTGMTYRELVRKIGKPFREGDCFGEGNSFGGTMLWKLDDHLYLSATFMLPETVTDTEEMVFPYDYVVTHFYCSTVADAVYG